jgi:hypothetical protein
MPNVEELIGGMSGPDEPRMKLPLAQYTAGLPKYFLSSPPITP